MANPNEKTQDTTGEADRISIAQYLEENPNQAYSKNLAPKFGANTETDSNAPENYLSQQPQQITTQNFADFENSAVSEPIKGLGNLKLAPPTSSFFEWQLEQINTDCLYYKESSESQLHIRIKYTNDAYSYEYAKNSAALDNLPKTKRYDTAEWVNFDNAGIDLLKTLPANTTNAETAPLVALDTYQHTFLNQAIPTVTVVAGEPPIPSATNSFLWQNELPKNEFQLNTNNTEGTSQVVPSIGGYAEAYEDLKLANQIFKTLRPKPNSRAFTEAPEHWRKNAVANKCTPEGSMYELDGVYVWQQHGNENNTDEFYYFLPSNSATPIWIRYTPVAWRGMDEDFKFLLGNSYQFILEVADFTAMGDASVLLLGQDLQGNPVSLAQRLVTLGFVVLPFAGKAVRFAGKMGKAIFRDVKDAGKKIGDLIEFNPFNSPLEVAGMGKLSPDQIQELLGQIDNLQKNKGLDVLKLTPENFILPQIGTGGGGGGKKKLPSNFVTKTGNNQPKKGSKTPTYTVPVAFQPYTNISKYLKQDRWDLATKQRFETDFLNADAATLQALDADVSLLETWKSVEYLKEDAKNIEYLRSLKIVSQTNKTLTPAQILQADTKKALKYLTLNEEEWEKLFYFIDEHEYRGLAESVKAGSMSIQEVVIQKEGIAKIKKHLSQFDKQTKIGYWKHNRLMIQRLEKIESGQMQVTDTDLYFYTHELTESDLMAKYIEILEHSNFSAAEKFNRAYDKSHAEVAKMFGISAKNEMTTFYTKEACEIFDAQLSSEY